MRKVPEKQGIAGVAATSHFNLHPQPLALELAVSIQL
jgi:hypothetical protein